MKDAMKSISELLLERLEQIAALEEAGGAETAPDIPLDQLPIGARPDAGPEAERRPDRSAARRAYAQGADSEPPLDGNWTA